MIKILMVEDDTEITQLLQTYLPKYSIDIFSVSSPLVALEKLQIEKFDLILLDLGLPQMDGLELCKIIKQQNPNQPVIISTARGDVTDKVIGFELGADDYVAKPYDPRELVARINVIVKRYKNTTSDREPHEFVIDKSKYVISHNGIELQLTMAEFEIFSILLEKNQQVVSREYILNSVNSMNWDSNDRSIDVIIGRIRTKIGDDSKNPKYIKSVRGVGYKFIG